MVRQIVWSQEALADLVEIKDYIAQTSPQSSEAVIRAIEKSADALITFPYSHRQVPELFDPDRRETFVHRWRLMYRILPDRIRIVGVIHGSRLLGNIDGRSFEEPAQAEYMTS